METSKLLGTMIASHPHFQNGSQSRICLEEVPNAELETNGLHGQAAPRAYENLYLTGRPTLGRFLHFVRTNAIHPEEEQTLTDQWKAAREHIDELEKSEAGLADDVSIRKLSSDYEPLLLELLKDPLLRNSFNTVPTEIGVVELDRLVVHQKHIDLTFVRELQRKLGPNPTETEIFRTCLPYDHPVPPVKWSKVGEGKYVVMSPSNDLRFLGPMRLKPHQVRDYPPTGNVAGVLGLAVGFGSNFMNAIYAEKRMILNNGSHRAYALREMGVTHAPCIIEHVTSREDLERVASTKVRRDPDLYLKHPRPSMLEDYFNPRLRKIIEVERQLTQITVKFEVEEISVPAM
jgi:hypothetical protein